MKDKFNREIDWSAIEPDWRAGIKSKIVLSEEHGVSRAAMDKHFGKLGIERDLVVKIRAKTQAKIKAEVKVETVANAAPAAAAEVPREVIEGARVVPAPSTQARLDAEEDAIIERESEIQVATVRRHQRSIARAWGVVDMLMGELEHQTENTGLYEELGILMQSPDDKGVDRLNDIYRKAISLPQRSDTVKKLLEAMKLAIGLEREALGITDRTLGSDDDPIAALVRSLQGTALKPRTIEAEYTTEEA